MANPTCFVNDFDAIIANYRAIGTKFDEEPLIAKFLSMIDTDSSEKDNLYVVFYNIILSLPKEFCTIAMVKERFLNFNSNTRNKKNSEGTEKCRRNDDDLKSSKHSKFSKSDHHSENSKTDNQ